MQLCTASETISFIRELEEKLAAFGETIAGKYGQDPETWHAYAKENKRYVSQVQMAYQSVITDAIEGCYAFDLETDHYVLNLELADGAGYAEAVATAVAGEETMIRLYEQGVEQSDALLADVPRNFKMILKKRKKRLEALKALSG